MARPRKDDGDKRAERFNLRFTLDELIHVQTQAAAAGLNVHEYARRRVLGHRVQVSQGQTQPALLAELNRVGVNLNQLTRTHNSGGIIEREAAVVLAELRGLLDRLVAVDGS